MNWQQLLKAGNELYKKQNLNAAIAHYKSAEVILEKEWQTNSDSIEIMQAWVSTLHNLATVYETLSAPSSSADYLLQAHSKVIARINDPSYSPMAQSLALRMSSITYKSIIEFNKKYATHLIKFDSKSIQPNQNLRLH